MSSDDTRQQGNRPQLVVQADTGDERYRQLAEREIIHVRRRHLGMAVLAVVWLGAGIAAMLLSHAFPRVLLWARSLSWPAVPCQVVSASVQPVKGDPGIGRGLGPHLQYNYQFGGNPHTSTRWRPGQPFFWASRSKAPRTASAAAARRLRGLKTCYVNPGDPSQSLLERTFPRISAIEVGALTLLCVMPGVLGFVWGARER